MPTITKSSPTLAGEGPLIEVQIGIPKALEEALALTGSPIPSPVTIQMMVDTGASLTMIRTGVAKSLGLSPIGTVKVSTASATGVPCAQYAVRLGFGSGVSANGKVVEAPFPGGSTLQGLLGRDVLAFGTLIYIGTSGVFSLSF